MPSAQSKPPQNRWEAPRNTIAPAQNTPQNTETVTQNKPPQNQQRPPQAGRSPQGNPRQNAPKTGTPRTKNAPQKKSVPRKPPVKKISREEKKRIAAIKKQNLKKRLTIFFILLLRRFIIYTLIVATAFSLSVAVFFINLHNNGKSGRIDYRIGNIYDTRVNEEISANLLVIGGRYYANMTDIAGYCSMITTGDSNELRYILRNETSDNVKFTINSSVAYINGIAIRLIAPVITNGTGVYVPLDFFNCYMSGITAVANPEEKTVTVERNLTEEVSAAIQRYESLTAKEKAAEGVPEIIYTELNFTPRNAEASENIQEHSIGSVLLDLTNPYREPVLPEMNTDNQQGDTIPQQ